MTRARSGPFKLHRLAAAYLLAGFAASSWAATASDAPRLPARASSIEGFVPPGWESEWLKRADFNRDGRRDAVFVLRRKVAAGETDEHERILGAALAQGKAQRKGLGGYVLAFENSRLIPRLDSPTLEDPLADGELVTQPNGFRLQVGAFSNAGSYAMATTAFTFRWREGCFRLVKYERGVVNRATLATVDTAVDYVTGRVTEKSGNAQSGERGPGKVSRATPLRLCAEDVGDAWRFDPIAVTRR